jgi:four helix bundle protein
MGAKSYEDLEVWQKAHQFVLDIYCVSRSFPREEVYGLTSQLQRAAASVAANIVEGFRRPTKSDKARFYQIALASLDETHYHLRLAHDLAYSDTIQLRAQADEVGRMLDSYTQAVIASARTATSTRNYGIGILMIGLLWQSFSLLASRF